MSTPDVTMQTRLPSLATGKGVSATIRLVTTSDGTEAWGTWSGGSVGGARTVQADSAGLVTFTDVVPNSLIAPANTYYEVKTQIGHRIITRTISVPNVAGPIDVDDDSLDVSTSTDLPATVAAADVIPAADGAIPMGQRALRPLVALMDDATTTVDIVCVGDSIQALSQWPDKVAQYLTNRSNTYRCIDAPYRSGWTGLTVSVGTEVQNGASGESVQLTTGQAIPYDPGDGTTGVTVVYRKSAGAGNILVKRDGSTVQTITTANATTEWSHISTTTAVALGDYEWTFEASGGTVVIEGAFFHRGTETAGVRVWNMALSGYDCAEWLSLTTIDDFIGRLTPDALVLALGTNDTTGTVVADMTALLAACATASPTTQEVIAVPYVANVCLIEDVRLIRGVAETRGNPTIDFHRAVGNVTAENDPFGLSSDNLHPNTMGSWMLADAAACVLSGDPLGSVVSMLVRGPREWNTLDITTTGTIAATGAITGLNFASTGNAQGKWVQSDSVAGSSAGLRNASTDAQLAIAELSAPLTNVVFGVNKAAMGFGQGGAALLSSILYEAATAALQTNADLTAKSLATTGKTGATAAAVLGGGVASGAPASGAHVVGEFTVDHTGTLQICTVAGTPGTWVDVRRAATTSASGDVELATAAEVITGTSDSLVSPLSAWASVSMLRPSDALVEAFPRGASTLANASTLTTQRMYFSAIGLPKGLDITGVCFESGATPASAPTNWWFGIFDSSRGAIRFTADQLTAAWGANTFMALALSSGYTTTYAGLYYLVVMVKATTVPTLAGISHANAATHGRTPIIAGTAADTGLTAPPSLPFTAGALTAGTPRPYCYVY